MKYSKETGVLICTVSILDLAKMGNLDRKLYNDKPKGVLKDISSEIIPNHIIKREKKVGGLIPFQRWIRYGKNDYYLRNLKDKRDLFYLILGFDYTKFALERNNENDRASWGAIYLSEWINIHRIDA